LQNSSLNNHKLILNPKI